MRAKLTKIEQIKESNFHEVGTSYIGEYFQDPEIGEKFVFFPDNILFGMHTSTVLDISILNIDINKTYYIQTKNSKYKLEVL